MINYQVFGLSGHLTALTELEKFAHQRTNIAASKIVTPQVERGLIVSLTVTDQDRNQIQGFLKHSQQLASQMCLSTVAHRVERFTIRLRYDISIADYHAEIRTLLEAFQFDLGTVYFYLYPREKAQFLLRFTTDWNAAIAAFKSIEHDSRTATDCYALEDNTGCVFRCMRILEIGLKYLAANVGLTFDLQQWHNIIEQIEAAITAERKTLPKGEARNERLRFLSEAAKEFFYFKDGWRNYVSHNRADYDEHQALGVLSHVRSFMNHLASQLSEAPP